MAVAGLPPGLASEYPDCRLESKTIGLASRQDRMPEEYR